MEKKMTFVSGCNNNRFFCTKLEQWLPGYEEKGIPEAREFMVLGRALKNRADVTFVEESTLSNTHGIDFIYQGIPFALIMDLEYYGVDFLVRDSTKVSVIQELIEDVIQEIMASNSKKETP